MRHLTTEELVRRYIAMLDYWPHPLSKWQEAHVISHWQTGRLVRVIYVSGNMKVILGYLCEPRNLLIKRTLRDVLYPARRVAWNWYGSHNYWPALRDLIGAGNLGLVIGAEHFRPEEGVRFKTGVKYWIRKELIRQAKFDRSSVTRPYDVGFSRDVMLDSLRSSTDNEIEIADSPVQRRRSLCIIPMEGGKQAGGGTFSDMLARGFARLKHGEDQIPILTRQIWSEVRNRYERPAAPKRVVDIASELGCSPARISQVTGKASLQVHAAVMSDAGDRRALPFPTWRNIDAWCDLMLKAPRRPISVLTWRRVRQTWRRVESNASKRSTLVAVAEWEEASDLNLRRVHYALKTGRQIPDELQSRSADFIKIIQWRRAAAKQDQEREARVRRFKELKASELAERCARRRAEECVTLTTKGYEEVRRIDQDREAESGAPSGGQGGDCAPAEKKSAAG